MSSENQIEMTVSLTEDDLYRAMVALTWKSRARTLVVLCVFAVILVVAYLHNPSDGLAWPAAAATATPVLSALLYVWMIHRGARATIRQTDIYRNPISYTLTESGVSASGPTFRGEGDWATVSRVLETRSFFLFSPTIAFMWVLPKRCFPDASAIERLRTIIRSRVSGKVKLLP